MICHSHPAMRSETQGLILGLVVVLFAHIVGGPSHRLAVWAAWFEYVRIECPLSLQRSCAARQLCPLPWHKKTSDALDWQDLSRVGESEDDDKCFRQLPALSFLLLQHISYLHTPKCPFFIFIAFLKRLFWLEVTFTSISILKINKVEVTVSGTHFFFRP